VGIACDTLITMNVEYVSLRSALRLMLRQVALTYIITDDVLLITGTDTLEDRVLVKTYPIDGLLGPVRPGQPQLGAEFLEAVIAKTIAPNTWKNKGAGVIVPYRLPNASLLVVRQNCAVHEETAALPGALRVAAGRKAAKPKLEPGQRLVGPAQPKKGSPRP
jgi:hypothetical protein